MNKPLVIAALLAMGCSEYSQTKLSDEAGSPGDGSSPVIAVSPPSVDFGRVSAASGDSMAQVVTIANIGSDDLTLTGVALDGDASFSFGNPGALLLPPGASTDMLVEFTPTADFEATGLVTIDSNDPETPTQVVDLLGTGTAPSIVISPEKYDFGELLIGCDTATEVLVENIGSEDLVVDSLGILDSQPDLELAVADLPWTLGPGESRSYEVYYSPLDELPDASYVQVLSNDPQRPEVMAQVTGSASAAPVGEDRYIQGGTFDQIDIIITQSEYFSCPSSMEPELHTMLEAAEDFLDALNSTDLDYQISVHTLTNGCRNGQVITRDMPNQLSAYETAIYGHSLSPDALFVAMRTMQETGPGGCNEGFLREDALTSVIAVADTDDTSDDAVDFYTDEMRAMAPNLVYNTISGPPPSACSPDAWPGMRFEDAANRLSGRQESICDADWTDHMIDLVLEAADGTAVPQLGAFELSDTPVVDSILVEIDGVQNDSDWSFDAGTNSVVFEAGKWPPKLSEIDISYTIAGSCEQ